MWWGRVVGSDEQRHGEGHEDEDLSTWQSHLEEAVHGSWVFPGTCPLDRVMVLAETESTQDAALRLCGGRGGLVVIAGRQTKGRGRLGRVWADTSHLGVAMTFVFDGKAYGDAHLSLAAGVAASKACGADVEVVHGVRMRWPNDVVEEKQPQRKIAGVLIERVNGLALVGVGVNVLQREMDWPSELRGRAVSLAELGREWGRLAVARGLVQHMLWSIAEKMELLVSHWRFHDILIGTRRAFVHNNHQYFGLVLDIDPLNAIRLQLADGREASLPAHSTSLVHE